MDESKDVNMEKNTMSLWILGIFGVWVVFEAAFFALGYFVSKWLYILAVLGILPVIGLVALLIVISKIASEEEASGEFELDYDWWLSNQKEMRRELDR